MNMRLLLLFLFISFTSANAQYSKTHYIAPSPWFYFDQTNELIISTQSTIPLSVNVKSSDGASLTTLMVLLLMKITA